MPDLRRVADYVEVRETIRGTPAGPAQFTRADPRLYHQLGFVQQPTEPPPPPSAPPTEIELRAKLAEAVRVQRDREETLSAATAALARAKSHLDHCRAQLSEFANLDDEVAAHTTEALRQDKHTGLPSQLHDRHRRRATARAAVGPAETALATFKDEHDAAERAAAEASKAARKLATGVAAFTAEAMADRVRELQAEVGALRRILIGFDRASVGNMMLPVGVRFVLNDVHPQEVYLADDGPWRLAIDSLVNDPQAEVRIELPKLTVAPLPTPSVWPPRVIVHPVKPPEPPDDGDPGFIPDGDEDGRGA
jgi:hypothetical protein